MKMLILNLIAKACAKISKLSCFVFAYRAFAQNVLQLYLFSGDLKTTVGGTAGDDVVSVLRDQVQREAVWIRKRRRSKREFDGTSVLTDHHRSEPVPVGHLKIKILLDFEVNQGSI